jgi:acyl-CoA dehydrogenase
METTQEINLLMDTVRRFVETEMFPHEEEIDRLGPCARRNRTYD